MEEHARLGSCERHRVCGKRPTSATATTPGTSCTAGHRCTHSHVAGQREGTPPLLSGGWERPALRTLPTTPDLPCSLGGSVEWCGPGQGRPERAQRTGNGPAAPPSCPTPGICPSDMKPACVKVACTSLLGAAHPVLAETWKMPCIRPEGMGKGTRNIGDTAQPGCWIEWNSDICKQNDPNWRPLMFSKISQSQKGECMFSLIQGNLHTKTEQLCR